MFFFENDLYMTGSDDDIERLLTLVGADQNPPSFDCDRIIPYPEPYRSMDADHILMNMSAPYRIRDGLIIMGSPSIQKQRAYQIRWGTLETGHAIGGRQWKNEHWGTPAETSGVKLVTRQGQCWCVTFSTIDSPPLPIIIELAKRFPTIRFTIQYYSAGKGVFGGYLIVPGNPDPQLKFEETYEGSRGLYTWFDCGGRY